MHDYPKISLLIDGKWRSTRDTLPVLNPADELAIGAVPVAGLNDLEDAVAAAEKGFEVWRKLAPGQRERVMLRAAELLRERIERIATVMTLEQGKTLRESRLEVERAADIIDWDATEGRRLYGRIIPAGPDMRHMVFREPIGVVASFSPWNFPISAPARKVAGALAAGCSIILKAAEETPASAYLLAQAFQDAGLPDGVLNLVFGNPAEISNYLIRRPAIRLVSLTGSTAVGRQVATLCAEVMKPTIMELGGHAPVIVCADADPVEAAKISFAGKSRNSGQVCVSPTRFFVEAPVYDDFVAEFGELARSITVGNGLDYSTGMGPLANARRVDAIDTLVRDCRDRGATVVAGGTRKDGPGYYYPLTVCADVPEDALAMRNEPFGPLALITRVDSVDEALSRANSLPYGLAGYAFTDSAATIAKLGDELQCGNLAINHVTASYADTPFGGVRDSGYGREGGTEGLQFYTTAKLVSHRVRR